MKEGAAIINTTSVTAYKGKPDLLDYSSTKGAIIAFTRSLSLQARTTYKGSPCPFLSPCVLTSTRLFKYSSPTAPRPQDPRQCRRPWSHLDAAHPGNVLRGSCRGVRGGGADEGK